MKNIKKILIILIILLIALVALLIFINRDMDVETDNSLIDSTQSPQDNFVQLDAHIAEETDYNKIFTINDYINQMFNYENTSNSEALRQMVSNYQEIETMDLKQKQSFYFVQEIYRRQSLENANYFVRGILRTIARDYTESLTEVFFTVNIDYTNSALSIEVVNQDAYNQEISDQESVVENFDITQNEYNAFELENFTTEDMCNNYISDFIIKLRYNRELAYSFLDDEYKAQKFGNNIANFNEYMDKNAERIYNTTIQSYSKEITEDSINYTILDTHGNYYIIKTNGGMEYKILLDNYTIEDEAYLEAYEQASEQEKVTTNLSKVAQWINTEDYVQIYNKLDPTFRQNNFADLAAFETYVENNFFNFNDIQVRNIEKIDNNFVCEVHFSSGFGVSAEEMTKTFIMQLGEGTDFVMSFTV